MRPITVATAMWKAKPLISKTNAKEQVGVKSGDKKRAHPADTSRNLQHVSEEQNRDPTTQPTTQTMDYTGKTDEFQWFFELPTSSRQNLEALGVTFMARIPYDVSTK